MKRRRGLSFLMVGLGCVSVLLSAPAGAAVPEEWGDPTYESAGGAVSARQDGWIPGRPGNQHVIFLHLPPLPGNGVPDLVGELTDWRCPAGVIAPVWADSETECHERARYYIRVDDTAGAVKHTWSPRLRWMAFRAPVEVIDYPLDAVEHTAALGPGRASLRLKGTGALTETLYDEGEERSSYLSRPVGQLVGGKILGMRWLDMDAITFTQDLYVYHEYAAG